MNIDSAVFERLRAHERARANRPSPNEIEEDSVWLHTDLGPSYFVNRDGRVLVIDATEPDAGVRPADANETTAALVLGVRNLTAPELFDLIPSAPSGSTRCARCDGTRWWSLPEKDFQIICPDCSGRGWTGWQQ